MSDKKSKQFFLSLITYHLSLPVAFTFSAVCEKDLSPRAELFLSLPFWRILPAWPEIFCRDKLNSIDAAPRAGVRRFSLKGEKHDRLSSMRSRQRRRHTLLRQVRDDPARR